MCYKTGRVSTRDFTVFISSLNIFGIRMRSLRLRFGGPKKDRFVFPKTKKELLKPSFRSSWGEGQLGCWGGHRLERW